jgi:hypothetical protein
LFNLNASQVDRLNPQLVAALAARQQSANSAGNVQQE